LHSGINAEIVRTGLRVLLYAADYAYKASDCMDTDHRNHDLATSICPKKIWAICRDWWQLNFTAFDGKTETMGFGVPFIRGKSAGPGKDQANPNHPGRTAFGAELSLI